MKILAAIWLFFAALPAMGQKYSLESQPYWNIGNRNAGGKINLNTSGLVCTGDCMQLASAADSTFLSYPSANFWMRSVTYKSSPCTCGGSIRCEGQFLEDSTKKEKFYSVVYYPLLYPAQPIPNSNCLVQQIKTSTNAFPIFALWLMPIGGHSEWVLWRTVDSARHNNNLAAQDSFRLGRVDYNSNIHFTIEANWSWTYNGYFKIYKEDTLLRTITGPTMNLPYNLARIAYNPDRNGIYDFGLCPNSPADNTNERNLYFNSWTVGDSTTVLADYIGTTPPAPPYNRPSGVPSNKKPAMKPYF